LDLDQGNEASFPWNPWAWSRIAELGLLQGALYGCAAATGADWIGDGVTVEIAEFFLYRAMLYDCTPHKCGLPWLRFIAVSQSA
jgi:hypothetical protein